MNEQIRKLKQQAVNFCLDKGAQVNLSEEVSEKFAELIIRECACIASDCNADAASFEIKQYFGV